MAAATSAPATTCANCCSVQAALISQRPRPARRDYGSATSPALQASSFDGLRRRRMDMQLADHARPLALQIPTFLTPAAPAPAGRRRLISCRSSSSSSDHPALAADRHAGRNTSPLNIVFVSAEVAPWSKTGGLGDVAGGLPPALAALGHRVMTVAPRYDQYRDAWDTQVSVDVQVGHSGVETVRFFHSYKKGVDRVFVDHPFFLAKVWGQTGSKLYGPETGEDYLDNETRFVLFNQAAIEAPLRLNFSNSSNFSGPYGEEVIFVCNDWHSALVPLYLKANYKSKGIFKNAKVAICIHNVAYQGRFAFENFSLLNLPDRFKNSLHFKDGSTKHVKGDKTINWLKAGISESDLVLTVSPNYASELVSGVDRGVELDSIIRETGITGIVNGMDVQEWDPSSDKYLEVKYDITTVLEAKPSLKEDLQAEVGLPVNPNIPVFGFIGRLEEQKGSDILAQAVSEIVKDDVQLIVLGTGKKSLQKQLEQLELNFPNKARGIVKFNAALGHKIIAGADFMLVPSRFEPCGLIQMYAMRYGTIPVVATTGGLVDTVEDGVTGFHIGRPFNVQCEEVHPRDVESLVAGVRRAVKAYRTPLYYRMVKASMSQDWSWKEPAKKWEDVLVNLFYNVPEAPQTNTGLVAARAAANQNLVATM